MKLFSKNILLISPEPWNHIHVSKHHYAIHLAKKGNKVFFLNPPANKLKVSGTKTENLQVIDYQGFWKGLKYYPKFLRIINLRTVFKRLESISEVSFDIVWSFDNSIFFDFDALPKKVLKISHIVDIRQNFQTHRASFSADICLGVIPSIVQRHLKFNKYSFLITHGVTLLQSERTISLPGSNIMKALYFGNLAMPHLNWRLLKRALLEMPEVDFLLLGSNRSKVPLVGYSNLYLIDEVASDLLKSYMNSADALFLFYSNGYHKTYASPHKMLEYLLSGKPIVSNWFDEYKTHTDIIYLSKKDEIWIQNLRAGLMESDENKKNARIQFAKSNSYENKLDRIERILADLPK